MTVPFFPSELPKPMRSGFSRGFGDNRRISVADAGPMAARPRQSKAADPVSLTLDLDRDELATFENWFLDDTRRGALPFWMPDPITDGWPILMEDGTPVPMGDGSPLLMSATWLCLFSQLPEVSVTGIRFRVAFGVSVLPA